MPFSLQFLGVGSAFSLPSIPGDLRTAPLQSNMVITASNGKRMLFDCGTDIRFSAQLCGLDSDSFDAVYISHEHADHVGGLEWLLLKRKFSGCALPHLFAEKQLLDRLWDMLYPSIGLTHEEGEMWLIDYVGVRPIETSASKPVLDVVGSVSWEGYQLELVRNTHVPSLHRTMHSFGMLIHGSRDVVFISSDTVFDHDKTVRIAEQATVLFHDCEVGPETGVHARYDELQTLPVEVRAKMWLYGYNPVHMTEKNAREDGFRGFVTRGQTFQFS